MPAPLPSSSGRLCSAHSRLENASTWFIIFIGLAVAGLVGMFLYGWRRRKEKPPPGVKPLADDEDDWK